MVILILANQVAEGREVTPKQIFDTCSKRYHYNRCDLVVAMAFVESRFNPDAFNKEEGARGLFQMKCGIARVAGLKHSCEQLYDPVIATRFAINFLKIRDKGYPDDVLVAAYNAKKVQYCKNFNRFSWGVCYPGELINQVHVDKVMKHLKYVRNYQLFKWMWIYNPGSKGAK